MYRYVAGLMVLALPQLAAAETVGFGAGLNDPNGNGVGHISGSASTGTPLTGKASWSGNGLTFDSGFVSAAGVFLQGTITRSNDPSLSGSPVSVYANPSTNIIVLEILGGPLNGTRYEGTGHVNVR